MKGNLFIYLSIDLDEFYLILKLYVEEKYLFILPTRESVCPSSSFAVLNITSHEKQYLDDVFFIIWFGIVVV